MILKNRFDRLCDKEANILHTIDTVKKESQNKLDFIARVSKEEAEKVKALKNTKLTKLNVTLDRITRLKNVELEHAQAICTPKTAIIK